SSDVAKILAACWTTCGRKIAPSARTRKISRSRRNQHRRRRVAVRVERKNRFRKTDAAVPRGPDHAGERQNEIIEREGGRFAGSARAWAARPDCIAAARGQNDFVEGNCKSNSGKSSADRADHFAGGRTSRGSDRPGARSRLPDLQFDL